MAEKKKPTALMKPVTPDAVLAALVGKAPIPRTEMMKKAWDYIKEHKLQNPNNKRNILADAVLLPLFEGKKEITMFELTGCIGKHLVK